MWVLWTSRLTGTFGPGPGLIWLILELLQPPHVPDPPALMGITKRFTLNLHVSLRFGHLSIKFDNLVLLVDTEKQVLVLHLHVVYGSGHFAMIPIQSRR